MSGAGGWMKLTACIQIILYYFNSRDLFLFLHFFIHLEPKASMGTGRPPCQREVLRPCLTSWWPWLFHWHFPVYSVRISVYSHINWVGKLRSDSERQENTAKQKQVILDIVLCWILSLWWVFVVYAGGCYSCYLLNWMWQAYFQFCHGPACLAFHCSPPLER